MSYLILIRHGESRWNETNKFTGWVDVPLSERGEREASLLARRLKHLRLDVAFSSHLERAHQTLLSILSSQHCTGLFVHNHEHGHMYYSEKKLGKYEIPIYTSWLLNERYYGDLQGLNKDEVAKKIGYEKVLAWRRGYDARPPHGESLHDVYNRALPYFKEKIMPEIAKKKNVLVVAHGNTLRALIKHIDGISDENIAELELAPGQPFIYAYKNKKFVKVFKGHSFNRPIAWDNVEKRKGKRIVKKK